MLGIEFGIRVVTRGGERGGGVILFALLKRVLCHSPGRRGLIDLGPRVPAPAERHRVPGLRDLSERSGPPGPGRPGPTASAAAAAAALGRDDARYAAHASRAGRPTGRGRGRRRRRCRRLIAVRSRFLGQREPFGAQVQVGHAAGDYLMERSEEAHFERTCCSGTFITSSCEQKKNHVHYANAVTVKRAYRPRRRGPQSNVLAVGDRLLFNDECTSRGTKCGRDVSFGFCCTAVLN